MALKIRLKRMGRKKAPHYRIVIAESTMPRDGRFVATIGHYNPTTQPETLKVDRDKAAAWLARGAVPTDTVRSLLRKSGALAAAEGGVVAAVTGAVAGAASATAKAAKGAAGKVADVAKDAAATVADAAGTAASAVAETAGNVVDAVKDAAESVADRVTGGDEAPAEAVDTAVNSQITDEVAPTEVNPQITDDAAPAGDDAAEG